MPFVIVVVLIIAAISAIYSVIQARNGGRDCLSWRNGWA